MSQSDNDDMMANVPEPGLPEKLPKNEHILWQGRPSSWALTRDALNMNWVFGYFVLVTFWKAGTLTDQVSFVQALLAAAPLMAIGLLVCGLLLGIGIIQARATTYTLTNKRVVLRIGAALTLSVNLPYSQILSADLKKHRNGTGTIAFDLKGQSKLGFLVCWPHVRPWHFRKPQPALRCIVDAEAVAGIMADAAETHLSMLSIEKVTPAAPKPANGGATVAAE